MDGPISRQKEARGQDYALLLFRMTSRAPYSAQYPGTISNTIHMTLNSLEHCIICTTSMTNIKPGQYSNLVPVSRLQAPVDTNEPSGLAISHETQAYS